MAIAATLRLQPVRLSVRLSVGALFFGVYAVTGANASTDCMQWLGRHLCENASITQNDN